MTTNKREIEWQYDAKDINTVANWLKAYPAVSADSALTVTPESSKEQVDLYLDTTDWRMLRAGYGLRVRRKGGQVEATMKSIAAAVDGLRQRREINETLVPVAGTNDCGLVLSAPGDVGKRVRQVAGRNPVRVLFEIHTHRTVYYVIRDGRRVGEVDLDDTTFPGSDPDHTISLQRIEIETAGEPQDVKELTKFVKHMVKDCHLREAKHSKFEAGLLSRDLKLREIKGADFGPTDIDPTSSVGELAWAVLRHNFAAMLTHEPGARLGDDAEEIHLMRVATRRLRAALNLFHDVLPQRIGRMRSELGWVAKELGAVRDLDVMIEHIGGWGAQGTSIAEKSDAYHSVAGLLSTLRQEEHQRLLKNFDSARYEKCITDFSRLLRKPPPCPSWSDVSAVKAMPELVTDRYRKARKVGDKLRPNSPAPDYHQLRIRAKRLRYGLEFTKRLYGKPVKATLAGMAALQDTLGLFQDAQIAIARLRAIGAEGQRTLPSETLQAIETVAHHYAQEAATVLSHFPKAYQHLKGKKWKGLWKAMREAR